MGAANEMLDGIHTSMQTATNQDDFESDMKDALAEVHDKGIIGEDVLVQIIECTSDMFELLDQAAAEHPEVDPDGFMENLKTVCNKVDGDADQFKEMFEKSFV